MNKYAKYIIIILLIFTMTGCQIECEYAFEQSTDEIEKIEIAYVNEGEITTKKELSSEEQSSIIIDILKLPCYEYWNDPINTIAGNALIIHYFDGTDEIISFQAQAYYAHVNYHYRRSYFDEDSFNALIDKYIENSDADLTPAIT